MCKCDCFMAVLWTGVYIHVCVYSVWTHDLLLSFTEARLGGLSKDEAKLCVVLSFCGADCKLYEPSVTIAATWHNIMSMSMHAYAAMSLITVPPYSAFLEYFDASMVA